MSLRIGCMCVVRRQTNSRSVKSRTGQLAEMFEAKFGQNNRSKCDIYKFTVGELISPRLH